MRRFIRCYSTGVRTSYAPNSNDPNPSVGDPNQPMQDYIPVEHHTMGSGSAFNRINNVMAGINNGVAGAAMEVVRHSRTNRGNAGMSIAAGNTGDASRTARRNGDVSGNSVLNTRLGMGRSNNIAGKKRCPPFIIIMEWPIWMDIIAVPIK